MPRWQAAAAGSWSRSPALVDPFLAQPDNFGLFMLLGTLSLWACARGLRGDRRAFALGGVLVGLAFLSRNDGVLLGVPFALAFLADLLRRPRASRIGWTAALAVRRRVPARGVALDRCASWTSSAPSRPRRRPAASCGSREYRDLYSVSAPATPASFLAQGLVPLLDQPGAGPRQRAGPVRDPGAAACSWCRSCCWARGGSAASWLGDPGSCMRAPVRCPAALLFAVHIPNGTFLHSAVALIPYAYLADPRWASGGWWLRSRAAGRRGTRHAPRGCSRPWPWVPWRWSWAWARRS